MGYSCPFCHKKYVKGPVTGTLIHECRAEGHAFNYRITIDGKLIPGHNHPGSTLIRDKSTSATKPDTAAAKIKKDKGKKKPEPRKDELEDTPDDEE